MTEAERSRNKFIPITCDTQCDSGRCNHHAVHQSSDVAAENGGSFSHRRPTVSSQSQSNQLFFDNSSRKSIIGTSSSVGGGNGGHPRTFSEFMKSRLFVSIVVFCAVFVILLCIGLVVMYEKDSDVTWTVDAWNDKLSAEQLHWFDAGLEELKMALHLNINTKRAKNVILFVADGMGPASATAARIYKAKEEGHLVWEKFPHMGLLKVREQNCRTAYSTSSSTSIAYQLISRHCGIYVLSQFR